MLNITLFFYVQHNIVNISNIMFSYVGPNRTMENILLQTSTEKLLDMRLCLRTFDCPETSGDYVIRKCHGAGLPALSEAAVAQNNL